MRLMILMDEDYRLPSASCKIFCWKLGCPEKALFHEARQAGWKADADGPAFRAYYCPAHVRELEGSNICTTSKL